MAFDKCVSAHVHNQACGCTTCMVMPLFSMCQTQPRMCGGESLLNGNSDNPLALNKREPIQAPSV